MPGLGVEQMHRPDLGAVVMVEKATKTTQRIALRQDGAALALCTRLAELKPQAQALCQTGRAQRLTDFLAAIPGIGRPGPTCTWPSGTLQLPSAFT